MSALIETPERVPDRPPRVGELVEVRSRRWLVEAVEDSDPEASPRVSLACADDDAQGQTLEVYWDFEIDRRILEQEAWSAIGARGFDPPRYFSAFLHTLRWNCVTATDPNLFQSPFRAGIKIDAYQMEPLRKALRLPRVNLFIADDTGLGKTIEAGLIARELLLRKKARTLVVAAPASVLEQWKAEMEERFGLVFMILDRAYLTRVRQERGFGVNPWRTHSRFLVSHNLLIDPTYSDPMREWLGELLPGSVLILDEAHHAAPSSGGRYGIETKFTRAIRDLGGRFEHRLFLSATPHNGHSNSFSTLLELLDPYRFTRGVPIRGKNALEDVMVRRIKEDIREIQGGFPKRKVDPIRIDGLPEDAPELVLSRLLDRYRELREERLKNGTARARAAAGLLVVGLQQKLLSSIEAFAISLARHRATVERQWERAMTGEGTAPDRGGPFIQPQGLVVSAPALAKAGAILNRQDIEGKRQLLGCIREREFDPARGPEPCLADFREFASAVLGWGFSPRGYSGTEEAPIPAELEVPLPDYGETLRPDFAVRERNPRDGEPPWQLLVQVLDAGQDLDAPARSGGAGAGPRLEVSPHGRAERLLRGTGVSAGLLFNGTALRLISAPRGESSGWMDFRVADMSRTAGRPLCSALRLLLSEQRLLALPRNQRLAALLEDSRKYQNEVSERLSEQVMHALYELLRGLQAADDASGGDLLREPLSDDGDRNDIYRGLLAVILRLVFLLYAEERGMLPEDNTFIRHYSLTGLYQRLREHYALHPDTMDQRFGAWAQLLVLFRLIHDGARAHRTGGAVALPSLEAAGQAYYEFRAALMVRNDEGMTRTYNRFHDPYENDPEIERLRELHAAMDRAVLDAYGWSDIHTDCEFLLDYEIDEVTWGRKKKPYRYRWPDPIRDEVLARLLALNAERAAEEARSGATSATSHPATYPHSGDPRHRRKPTSRFSPKVAVPNPLGPFFED